LRTHIDTIRDLSLLLMSSISLKSRMVPSISHAGLAHGYNWKGTRTGTSKYLYKEVGVSEVLNRWCKGNSVDLVVGSGTTPCSVGPEKRGRKWNGGWPGMIERGLDLDGDNRSITGISRGLQGCLSKAANRFFGLWYGTRGGFCHGQRRTADLESLQAGAIVIMS
jgi:hypothetical protein